MMHSVETVIFAIQHEAIQLAGKTNVRDMGNLKKKKGIGVMYQAKRSHEVVLLI